MSRAVTARQPLTGDEIYATITHLNDDHAEALLYCVRAFTPQWKAERAELRQLFSGGFEVDCAGQRFFVPFVGEGTLEEQVQATFLEAMKRLGVWPPRRVAHWQLEKNERVGAHFRRLTLALNGDDRSDWRPGDSCRFDVAEGQTPRPYTLRRVDAGRVLVDIYSHESSPGSRWARELRPGETVTARGERHELFPDFAAGETWLLGDETALPTIAALLETWPHHFPLHVLLQVRDAGDRAYLDEVPLPPEARLTWVDHLQDAAGWPGTAPAAVWAAAEVGASLALKKTLKARFPAADVNTIGYWRQAP